MSLRMRWAKHDAFEVSQNHRMLLEDGQAELLYGEAEVLVKAKDMIKDHSIRIRKDAKPVVYFHLLFEKHEIIFGNNVLSESFFPGRQAMKSFDAETHEEVLRLMPTIDQFQGYGYGPTARTVLRTYESRVLLN